MRHISLDRVYLGEVRLGDEWFPGLHEALVEPAQFKATLRGHTKGQRRSRDLLSRIVRCGLCGKVAGVHWNDRNQAIYRHRGQGCVQSGRSANGLHRAAGLGLRVLSDDKALQVAIRAQLAENRHESAPRGPTATSTITSLNLKERKLLDRYYADKIGPDAFAVEARRITTLQSEIAASERKNRDIKRAVDKFDHVAALLTELDLESLWEEASAAECRVLVEDLIDSISFDLDRLTVQLAGAPPILVTLEEDGLHDGSKPVVSEG